MEQMKERIQGINPKVEVATTMLVVANTMCTNKEIKVINIISSAWLMSPGIDAVKLEAAGHAPAMDVLLPNSLSLIGCEHDYCSSSKF
jgi:hypothetical protein